MSEYNFEVGDKIVVSDVPDAYAYEVVSVSNRGYTLGVKGAERLRKNEMVQYIDASIAIKLEEDANGNDS